MSKAASLVCNFNSHTKAFPQTTTVRSESGRLPLHHARTEKGHVPRAPGRTCRTPGSEGGSTCAQDRAPHPAARGARQSGNDVGEAEQTRTGENTVVCRAAGAAAPRHSNGLWHVGGGVHAVTLKCPDIWGE